MNMISPYPENVTLKHIADGSQVFVSGKYAGHVEKRNNWGIEWVARPENGTARAFKTKTESVNYLIGRK